MDTVNGQDDHADLLAILRMMFYTARELDTLGYKEEAQEMRVLASRLQKRGKIGDAQLFVPSTGKNKH